MVKTTREQRQALLKVYRRTYSDGRPYYSGTYREFRSQVQQGFGYIMVQFAGMHLGIEPDGYTHS